MQNQLRYYILNQVLELQSFTFIFFSIYFWRGKVEVQFSKLGISNCLKNFCCKVLSVSLYGNNYDIDDEVCEEKMLLDQH